MRTIHFNTGRLYSPDGQRITATLHEAGQMVTFYDHDRMIDGAFKLCGDRFDSAVVMDAYDRGIARSTALSQRDGLYTGGCNTRWHG